MRRDVLGASGHVTVKPSLCDWGTFCKSGVYAVKVTSLTPGDLPGALEKLSVWQRTLNTREESAEGIVSGQPPLKAPTMKTKAPG